MSQKQRLLARLQSGRMCAMEPLEWSPRIYRVAARIMDLRHDGHTITTFQICTEHADPASHAMYEIVMPGQMELV